MLTITKAAEPACLKESRTQYEAVHGAVSDDAWESPPGSCKQAMREAAWLEQGGLCAYCMSPLSGTSRANSAHPEAGGMKLEHFEAQHAAGQRTLDWDNLLGVCPGVVVGRSAGESGTNEAGTAHCDTHRGHLPPERQFLSYSPAKAPPDVSALYRYDKLQGDIQSDDAGATQDIERLNLNLARLKRNRRAVLDAIRRQLQKDASTARLLQLRQHYAEKDKDGRLRPYAGVGLWYIGRKLRQR
ncbi:hypothetical protein D7X30_12915 [Corallococcus sp. AB011P]|nr:hypothetical protein D7X30_12915 [Corallococcus sp. AB011P]